MYSKVKQSEWRGEPLPRGRHKLAARAVRSSQRDRLLRAIVEVVARRGFERATVAMVVSTARVSSNTFYEHFTDKTDCFLAACDATANELLEELTRLVSEPDWIEAITTGMGIYLRWWQARPAFARAYLLSLPHVGERAAEQRNRTYELFETMFAELGRRARAEQPELPALHSLVPRALVVAVTDAVTEQVRAGRIMSLERLAPELAWLSIKLLADEATAERPAHRASRGAAS